MKFRFTGSLYDDALHLPALYDITGFDLGGGAVEIFAVGLDGLILHKNSAVSSDWEIMSLNTTDPSFLRLWGHAEANNSADNLMAVGFDNYTSRAIIYQYRLWAGDSEKSWEPLTVPETRTGFISSLSGIWGESTAGLYHAVGNEGTSLYLDTSEDPYNKDWRQMVTGVDSSFN